MHRAGLMMFRRQHQERMTEIDVPDWDENQDRVDFGFKDKMGLENRNTDSRHLKPSLFLLIYALFQTQTTLNYQNVVGYASHRLQLHWTHAIHGYLLNAAPVY